MHSEDSNPTVDPFGLGKLTSQLRDLCTIVAQASCCRMDATGLAVRRDHPIDHVRRFLAFARIQRLKSMPEMNIGKKRIISPQ